MRFLSWECQVFFFCPGSVKFLKEDMNMSEDYQRQLKTSEDIQSLPRMTFIGVYFD